VSGEEELDSTNINFISAKTFVEYINKNDGKLLKKTTLSVAL